MRFNIYLYFAHGIVFFIQYKLINGKPMIGRNIREARAGEFNYVVSLMRVNPENPDSGGEYFCSGVLITRDDVLTSAHCVEEEALNLVQLVVETIDLRRGRVLFPWWWQTYDQWAVMFEIRIDYDMNDIANIRLLESSSSNFNPVRLSTLSNTELYGSVALIAGWGKNSEGIVPDIMNIGEVQILENYLCERKLARLIGETILMNSRVLCSFTSPYTLLEEGDSGGPLLFRNRLIGINKGICPINIGAHPRTQMNLHIGVDYFRPFINFMKNI